VEKNTGLGPAGGGKGVVAVAAAAVDSDAPRGRELEKEQVVRIEMDRGGLYLEALGRSCLVDPRIWGLDGE
jgi:hypothetical protein